jgi:hypothetical protein
VPCPSGELGERPVHVALPSRSYESRPMSGRPSIVSVRMWDPSRRASPAGRASSKKSQTCPPLPERERSSDAGSCSRLHASRNATASSRQPDLSKSTARKKHVSSRSSGYTPATKDSPSRSYPDRCQRMTSSVTGRNRRWGHSAHLMRGFSQMPRTHSFAQAGAYPDLPVFRLSNRRG